MTRLDDATREHLADVLYEAQHPRPNSDREDLQDIDTIVGELDRLGMLRRADESPDLFDRLMAGLAVVMLVGGLAVQVRLDAARWGLWSTPTLALGGLVLVSIGSLTWWLVDLVRRAGRQ